jgi:hypothetical protein
MNDTLLVFGKKILKIPKQKDNQNPEIEEQTAQWPKVQTTIYNDQNNLHQVRLKYPSSGTLKIQRFERQLI